MRSFRNLRIMHKIVFFLSSAASRSLIRIHSPPNLDEIRFNRL